MKFQLIILVLLLFSLKLNCQSIWEFKPSIERNDFYILEGKIDGKYPIEIFH